MPESITLASMGTTTFVEEFKEGLKFVALEGQPNLFLIHSAGPATEPPWEKMTGEDWNEFERHIKRFARDDSG